MVAGLLSPEGISLIALNVAMFGSFIGIFFFTFGAYVEKVVLQREIKLILDGLVGNIKTIVPDALWSELQEHIHNLPDADTSGDQATRDANSALLKKALIIFGIMLAVALVTVFGMWFWSGKAFKLGRLFSESFGLLLFVAMVEFLFYWLVAANYRTVDANFVKKIIVRNAQTYAESTNN